MPREGGFVLISVFSTALKEQAQGLVGKSGSGETGPAFWGVWARIWGGCEESGTLVRSEGLGRKRRKNS